MKGIIFNTPTTFHNRLTQGKKDALGGVCIRHQPNFWQQGSKFTLEEKGLEVLKRKLFKLEQDGRRISPAMRASRARGRCKFISAFLCTAFLSSDEARFVICLGARDLAELTPILRNTTSVYIIFSISTFSASNSLSLYLMSCLPPTNTLFELQVRGVATCDLGILTGSRDKTVKIWKESGPGSYELNSTLVRSNSIKFKQWFSKANSVCAMVDDWVGTLVHEMLV